jgi:hypothetical protein
VVITHRVNKTNFRAVFNSFFAKASDLLDAGYPELELKACTPKRSVDQNRKLWALLNDISKQVEHHGKKYSSEDWKDILTAGFEKAQRYGPNLDGTGLIAFGARTSEYNKKKFAEFVEFIYAAGSERGVVWSETAEEYAGNYR